MPLIVTLTSYQQFTFLVKRGLKMFINSRNIKPRSKIMICKCHVNIWFLTKYADILTPTSTFCGTESPLPWLPLLPLGKCLKEFNDLFFILKNNFKQNPHTYQQADIRIDAGWWWYVSGDMGQLWTSTYQSQDTSWRSWRNTLNILFRHENSAKCRRIKAMILKMFINQSSLPCDIFTG